jgi:hypothetical protein
VLLHVALQAESFVSQLGKNTLIKKENKIFFIYKEIQKGAVAKSYMTNGLLRFD